MKKYLLGCFLFFGTVAHAQISFNMTLLGQYDNDSIPTNGGGQTFNDIWGYADDGREYAIMGSASYVHFIDVTDPANFVVIEEFPGGDTTTWRDIKTYKNRAYTVSDATNEGLLIFDLSNLPTSVSLVKQTPDFFESAHNIYIDEENGRLYACGTNTQSDGLIVLDIAVDPDNPTLLASVTFPSNSGYVHDLYVRNNIVFASHGWEGFHIWDFTDPANPIAMASAATNGYNHSNWVSEDGEWAIFAEEVPRGLPLGVANLEDLSNGSIEVEHYFSDPLLPDDTIGATPHNPYILGNYAFVSYYEDGVQIFDMSDPTAPVKIGWYDTFPNNTNYVGYFGCWGVYPYLPSGNIIASDRKYGLHILRFNDPTSTKDFEELEVAIFPNPSHGFFQIKINDAIQPNTILEITDLSGKIIQTIELQSNHENVDLTQLPNGFYFGKITMKGKHFIQKLIIQK